MTTNNTCIHKSVCDFCDIDPEECGYYIPTSDLISKSKLLEWIPKAAFVASGTSSLIQADSLVASTTNGDFDIERSE